MARHLRIEYPNAFYHVYSRGNQKQPIFFSDDDRFFYLRILGKAAERLSARVHVYCLMPNHYHFILETPLANLSQIMHFINTSYSVYLNLKHGRCGHLFQGRFKAILMDAESYARILTFYIHGNPVRKNIVARPEEIDWSSAAAYFGVAAPQCWLHMETILAIFGGDRKALRAEHDYYLLGNNDMSTIPELARAERIGILGNDDFIDKVRKSHLRQVLDRHDGEVPEISRLRKRPELATINACVAAYFGPSSRLIKKVSIFIAHKNTNYRLKDIGDVFGIGPIAVSTAFRKMQRDASSSETLRRTIAEIERNLFG
jgi:putative transposase